MSDFWEGGRWNRPDLYRAALKVFPDLHLAHRHLAYTTRDIDEAKRHIEQAMELNPYLPGVYGVKGVICAREGRLRECKKALRKAAELQEKSKRVSGSPGGSIKNYLVAYFSDALTIFRDERANPGAAESLLKIAYSSGNPELVRWAYEQRHDRSENLT